MASVLVPVLYLLVLVGGLLVFGRAYSKRQAAQQITPYFPRHVERDTYVTLLGLDPPTPDALLKAALIRRAMQDVHRIVRLREDKPAMQALLQKGLLGDDIWTALLAAEKEMEAEILEVQHEANTFVEGWGGIIFNTASEMVNSKKVQAVFEAVPKMRAEIHARYGKPPPVVVQPQPPSTPASPKTPADRLKARLPSSPQTPSSPLRVPSDTLAPPSSAASDGNITSDGEGPRSPSKSKKNKKRK
ncbi:unnamed protein product [Peniophora sp. CBMAI 1063]|nr:unnamed protein product [Peniophora sp. CBMAI 1063]